MTTPYKICSSPLCDVQVPLTWFYLEEWGHYVASHDGDIWAAPALRDGGFSDEEVYWCDPYSATEDFLWDAQLLINQSRKQTDSLCESCKALVTIG